MDSDIVEMRAEPEQITFSSDIEEEADEQWKTTWDFNSMLEVYGILYLGRDDVEPRNQLGRIYMTYPYGIRHMYNVTEVDETRETLTTGDEFDIMDIKSPFPYLHECTNLYFDLFGGAYKGNLAPVFTEGLFDERDDSYFRELTLESKDGTGQIILLMGFYAHATIAKVELRLINSPGKVVCGTVAASDLLFDKDLTTSVLFLKDQHQGIAVGPDGLIPLARSRVAVQYDSTLCLDICLQVDGQTFLTTLDFPAHKIGVHNIILKYFEHLEVTVKWNALKHDSEDDDDDP